MKGKRWPRNRRQTRLPGWRRPRKPQRRRKGEAPEETVPETIAPTTEATEPEETESQPDYNRKAVAQISYPDWKEAAPTGFAGLVASVQNLFRERPARRKSL